MKYIADIINPGINPRIGNTAGIPAGSGGDASVLQLFLTNFIQLGFVIAAVVFFFMLLWGAVEYITAGGDKERTSASTKRLTGAIVGLSILFSLYVVLRLARDVFGIDILQLAIPVIQ